MTRMLTTTARQACRLKGSHGRRVHSHKLTARRDKQLYIHRILLGVPGSKPDDRLSVRRMDGPKRRYRRRVITKLDIRTARARDQDSQTQHATHEEMTKPRTRSSTRFGWHVQGRAAALQPGW